jgi:hypothetical protein
MSPRLVAKEYYKVLEELERQVYIECAGAARGHKGGNPSS